MRKSFRLLSLTLAVCLSIGMTACNKPNRETRQTKTHQTLKPQAKSKKSSSKSSSHKASTKQKAKSSSSSNQAENNSDNKEAETPSASSSFNLEALTKGDYTSISGTWADSSGRVVVISPQGRISVLGTTGSISVSRDGKGEALMTVTYDDGTSFSILMYGAGQPIPDRHFQNSQADPSDTSKDRLVTAYSDILDSSGTDQFKNQVLYKSSDDYSSLVQ